MPSTVDEIIRAALELTEAERSQVAGELLDSLDQMPGLADDTEALHAELERRSGDLKGAVEWETLRDELRGIS